MKIISSGSKPKGAVHVPPSKSHSIRALFWATLADGLSTIKGRLKSDDVDSAIHACRCLGAEIEENGKILTVNGTGGDITATENIIDVGNSGTTARFVTSLASLSRKPVTITGDESTCRRPMGALFKSLRDLGVSIEKSTDGKFLPATVRGPIRGGVTAVDGTSSQFLSSLLVHSPFSDKAVTLRLKSLNEKPYVDMTLNWMSRLGIEFEHNGYAEFRIPPRQSVKSFDAEIPSDFSSATFFLSLAAIEGTELELLGLDMEDSQGDKKVIDFLIDMGADINCGESIKVKGRKLKGRVLDLNSTPDALPAMAVVACLAEGTTELINVPQARIKETDRIAVMTQELRKMGADIKEREDGLVIQGGRLNGAKVEGHFDHRVVMSLSIAGFAAEGKTEISTAEAINITFPNFVELMQECGANIKME